MANTSYLPPETLIAILRLVKAAHPDSKRDLRACALVSRTWSECAMPILYRDITIFWSSWFGKRLIRTIEGDPSLTILVRAVSVDYGCIGHWLDHEKLKSAVQESMWEVYLDRLLPEDRKYARRSASAQAHFGSRVTQREIDTVARRRAWETAMKDLNGDWVEGGPEGLGPRLAGAKALFTLLERFPRLRRLELGNFEDLGVNGVPLPLLNSLEHLVIGITGIGQDRVDASPLVTRILDRTPNLQELDIRSACSTIPLLPTTTLSELHTIHYHPAFYRRPTHSPDAPFLDSLLALTHNTLRHVHLAVEIREPELYQVMTTLLLTATSLETLDILFISFLISPSLSLRWAETALPPAVLSDLSLSPSLRTLHFPCPLSPDLLASLPPSLSTLVAFWPVRVNPPLGSSLAPLLRDLLRKKEQEGSALERVAVTDVPTGSPLIVWEHCGGVQLELEEESLLEELGRVGVKVVLGRRRRQRGR